MVFSVFTQPVFLFSDSRKSNYFGPKAHSPGSRAGRAEAWSSRDRGAHGSQPAVGMSGWPAPICWCHCMGLAQHDRVLQVVF